MTAFDQRPLPLFAALAILAASAVPASPAPIAAAKPNFDGNWSVLIVTERGTCDRAYRYPVRISNGSVGYAGEASFNVTGRVGANGAVTVTVSRGNQSATARDAVLDRRLRRWGAASGECSGTWTAERRGKASLHHASRLCNLPTQKPGSRRAFFRSGRRIELTASAARPEPACARRQDTDRCANPWRTWCGAARFRPAGSAPSRIHRAGRCRKAAVQRGCESLSCRYYTLIQ